MLRTPCADDDLAPNVGGRWRPVQPLDVDRGQPAEGVINWLCVRTDDKDNRALSFAWGVAERRP